METDKERKERRNKIIIAGAILIIFLVSLVAYSLIQKPESKGVYTKEFTQCLVDSGAKMYGAWWCPHCEDQKKAFGESWKILVDNGAYIECSNADKSQNQLCTDAGIQGYPTWRFRNGNELFGFLPYTSFVSETGCALT